MNEDNGRDVAADGNKKKAKRVGKDQVVQPDAQSKKKAKPKKRKRKKQQEKLHVADLHWIRCYTPYVIPRYLVNQIKDKTVTTERWYRFHEINCLMQGTNGPKLNPFHHLYALVNEDNEVKGLVWFNIDPMSVEMLLNSVSIDKQYWNSDAIRVVKQELLEIMKHCGIAKGFWFTKYPKLFERNGFQRSKNVLMQIKGDDTDGQDTNRRDDPQRQCSDVNAGAAEPAQQRVDSGGAGVCADVAAAAPADGG